MHRIHIVGASPRSGTTLLAEAMIACFHIDLFSDHEARIFSPPPHAGNIFLTKAPRDILLAEAELEKSSELFVLYMLRDPRNIIVSKHRRNPDRYWAGLKFWKTYSPCARRLKHHPRFISVRYEDLLNDPDAVQASLKQRMPFLQETGPFSKFHEVAAPAIDALTALNGLRPITAEGADRWRLHLPRVAGQIALHGSIAEDLIEFGYEDDDAWLSELAGIEPDTSPSHWPEYFTQQSLERMLRAP